MLYYAISRLNIRKNKLSSAHIHSLLALIVALALTLPACSTSQSSLAWNRDFLAAAQYQDTEQFDQAEQRYRTLRAQAPNPEKKRDIDYELAKILQKRGDKAGALQAYLAIANYKTKDNPGGKSLYEAARIDGASRFQQMYQITMPLLKPTMKVIFMLNILGLLRIFDQIYVMRNGVIQGGVDVIMTYVYDMGIQRYQIGFSSAISVLVLLTTLFMTAIVWRITGFGRDN